MLPKLDVVVSPAYPPGSILRRWSASRSLKGMRVLVAEDDRRLREILARGLAEEHYIVDSFERGDEAEIALDVGTYDIAILDWNLPGRSGLQICRRLRERGISLPVLFLTARDSETDRVHGLDTGADDYLIKPFVFDELLARLRAVIRRGAAVNPQAGVGGLVLDQVQRQARIGSAALDLTAREFAVLEKLVLRAGAVVTRAELARSTLSDDTGAIGSNSFSVHVSRIRQRLREADADVVILTVRGVGFRLVSERRD
jgi:DNA-binding response OmpR family regulator